MVRLAALDSARPPRSPLLLAELDDELCVAVSLVDCKTIADPFRRTDSIRAAAVELARGMQLREEPCRVRRPPILTRAFNPAI